MSTERVRQRIVATGASALCLCLGLLLAVSIGKSDEAAITVDYPADGAIFPPDMVAPVFRWRDSNAQAKMWRIEISFDGHRPPISATSDGPRLQIGEIDQRVVVPTNRPPVLTPEEAEGHTWTPDGATWALIKESSVRAAAKITITGYADDKLKDPISRGQSTLWTSADPVSAPIFYRDVPLIPSETKKGIISPIPKDALGLVAWRLRDISQPKSQLLMTGISTCVNCHSFSRDGKTMGIDVDGPEADRGLYALMPVKQQTLMQDANIVKWRTFQGPLGGNLRIGFMSQVSPDGKYVLTTINDPHSQFSSNHRSDVLDRYYTMNFLDYRFLQVFYPTRGILAWYSRETGHLQPLPGADDDRYLQACGVWSPDGKYIVFIRAEARSAYPDGPRAEYATDPKETQIQYDLYRIPFNDGKGGKAERIAGASENGMSNSFPKVSPDGKWIVYVQAHNGLLMRPDSKLYIVPSGGGEARQLKCNTRLMNSWHSWSPNGRWLVFSSKARSPYTQMYLTHIDENGNDSPAILVPNSTAANRAINIPEFVNIKPGTWTKLEAPLADFFHQIDVASDLAGDGKLDDSIAQFQKALKISSGDARAHYYYGRVLEKKGRVDEAIKEYESALSTDPTSSMNTAVYVDLGEALGRAGQIDQSIASYEKALDANPGDPRAHAGLASELLQKGQIDDSVAQCEMALKANPRSAAAYNTLGAALARSGKLADAVAALRAATALDPDSFEYRFNLGRVLAAQSSFGEALLCFKRAVELSEGKDEQSLSFLASMYGETGQPENAVEAAQRALAIAQQNGDRDMVESLQQRIAMWQGGGASQ